MAPRILSTALASLTLAGAALTQTTPIDLTAFQTIQYEFNFQPDANWALQPGNTAVVQTVNSDASIFLSDFDAVGQEINGTWRVQTASDDDFMGFVFGYQGRGQYYLFDWKKTDQTHVGFAERGMSLKIVQTPLGTDPLASDLWPSAGSANVTVPLHNTIPWVTNVFYDFKLVYTSGNIDITVSQAGQVLEHWTLTDSTYSSGKFGFYNYSQDQVRYEGFTQQDVVSIYCTAKTNSQGCVPTLVTSGFASLSDQASFDLSAALLINNMNASLVYSRTGPASTPFNGGFLCLAPPLYFTPLLKTAGNAGPDDCSGTLSFDFNAWLQGGNVPGVAAGDSLYAQFFYRDPVNLDGMGTGLTAGVKLVVLP